eukprot:7384343-Prymnesium_polylepis.1
MPPYSIGSNAARARASERGGCAVGARREKPVGRAAPPAGLREDEEEALVAEPLALAPALVRRRVGHAPAEVVEEGGQLRISEHVLQRPGPVAAPARGELRHERERVAQLAAAQRRLRLEQRVLVLGHRLRPHLLEQHLLRRRLVAHRRGRQHRRESRGAAERRFERAHHPVGVGEEGERVRRGRIEARRVKRRRRHHLDRVKQRRRFHQHHLRRQDLRPWQHEPRTVELDFARVVVHAAQHAQLDRPEPRPPLQHAESHLVAALKRRSSGNLLRPTADAVVIAADREDVGGDRQERGRGGDEPARRLHAQVGRERTLHVGQRRQDVVDSTAASQTIERRLLLLVHAQCAVQDEDVF